MKILFAAISIMQIMVYQAPTFAHDDNWQYPKHIQPCIEAMSQIGEERDLIGIMGAKDINDTGCKISIIFPNEDARLKFDRIRSLKGLSPDYEIYQGQKIAIVKAFGKIVSH